MYDNQIVCWQSHHSKELDPLVTVHNNYVLVQHHSDSSIVCIIYCIVSKEGVYWFEAADWKLQQHWMIQHHWMMTRQCRIVEYVWVNVVAVTSVGLSRQTAIKSSRKAWYHLYAYNNVHPFHFLGPVSPFRWHTAWFVLLACSLEWNDQREFLSWWVGSDQVILF